MSDLSHSLAGIRSTMQMLSDMTEADKQRKAVNLLCEVASGERKLDPTVIRQAYREVGCELTEEQVQSLTAMLPIILRKSVQKSCRTDKK